MHILHLAKYYWPHSGGMARVVQGLAQGEAAKGHRVEVVAIEPFVSPLRPPQARKAVLKAVSFGSVASTDLAPGYLFKAWRGADLIHLHHPHTLADVASLLRLNRAPLVVTHHGDNRRTNAIWLTRAVLRRASAIVVPSRAHIALSKELTGFESKVEVIPFGIDERRWAAVPPRTGPGPARALFIGRLERYKGVDVLLRALEQAPDVSLDIVGGGPDGPRLKTLAQALALTDRVRWFGEWPDEDLPRRMADADFLVLPSVTVDEMFGLVLLEAMAAGRPIITTAVPSGVREVNVPGETGLEVPIRDPHSLAEAINTLAADPGLRARMGEVGRSMVRERYSLEMMVERYLEVYRKVSVVSGDHGPVV